MKVVVVSWRDLANPLAGGAEVLVDHLLLGLQERGHDVTLVCGGPVSKRPYRVIEAGGTYSQYLIAPIKIRRLCRDADVIVDCENGIPYFSPLWWSKPSVCLVHHIHREQWADRFPKPFAAIFGAIETKAMPLIYRNRTFISVSASTTTSLEQIGVAPGQIRLAESGVDQPDLVVGDKAAEPLFVSLGRLVPHKRTELLVEAWKKIHDEVGGHLVIVGDGPELKRIEDLADGEPSIQVRGRVSDRERTILLQEAWLLVTSTHHEGWGMTVLEAAACGTPALAFDVPGIRDVIFDGETGLLVPDGGADAVARFGHAWKTLVADPELLARLGRDARKRADASTWASSIDTWEEILLEAVASGSG